MAFNITEFSNNWANFKNDLKTYFNTRAIDKNGDIMIGELVLSKYPDSDMGVVAKQHVIDMTKQFTEFIPGKTRNITWGEVKNFPTTTIYKNYYSSGNPAIEFGTNISMAQSSTHTSLANGKVVLNCIIPKFSVAVLARKNSGYSFVDVQGAQVTISATLSVNNINLFEENNTVITTAEDYKNSSATNSSSIFSTSKNIIDLDIPVSIGKGIEFKLDIVMHSLVFPSVKPSNVSGYDQCYVDAYFSSDSMPFKNLETSIGNPLFDTTMVYK